jgi:hypothetical protein
MFTVRSLVRFRFLLLALFVLRAADTAAQGQSGAIAGVVKDSSGALLPGVTVEASSPALIEKVRAVATDGSGQYRIVDLRPGTYAVTFTLPGFSTVRREGVELTSGFTATVNGDMKVGQLEETVTVSGATPVVDTSNVVKLATASREVMDVLPTDRNFVSFAALTPSVLVTAVRQNVGGSIPETGMNLVVHGSRGADSMFMLEGMPIINGEGTGGISYGNYLSNAMAQEITFQTDSHNAEFERASVYSNFILKEGSNAFRGSFFTRYAGENWQSANLDDEQRGQGLTTGNRIKRIWDVNPAFGGPIVADRLWVYGSYRHWGTYNTVAGAYQPLDFSALFYEPSTEQSLFPVQHQNGAVRLTTQVSQRNKVNVYYNWQYSEYGNCFVPTYQTAVSACPVYKNHPQYIMQANWSAPVTNKLLFEAGGTFTPSDYHGYRQPGVSATQFSINDPLAPAGYPTTWGSSATGYGFHLSHQMNYRASASYVTGSHAFKVGASLMHAWRYTTQEPNNAVALSLRSRQPFSITEYATPISYRETLDYNAGIYAQDQWRVKRLTFNYGVRLDMLKASVDAQELPAGPFTPARSFDTVENVPNWKDVSPRLGVAWDVFGDGRTAVKGSIGRYVLGDSYTLARAVNPVLSTVNSVTRTWAAPPGVTYTGTYNPYDDCDLFNPAANTKRPGEVMCGAISNPAFGQVGTRLTNYDPAIVQGWGVRPSNTTMQLSVQRELMPRVSAYAAYSRRSYGNLTATRNLNVTNADFTPYCIPVPSDARLSKSGQLCGLNDVNRNIAANNLVFNADRVGGIDDAFDGLDFDVNARLARNIFVSGGVSVGRERVNLCNLKDDLSLTATAGPAALTATSPRLDSYCDVHQPWLPQLKGQVAYPLPAGVNISATFQSLSGPVITANYPLTNAIASPSLGRPFTSVPPTIDLLDPSSMYGDRIFQTDLRLSKTLRLGHATIRPTVSVYNLFNANPVQTYNTTYGPAWTAPTVIMQARFVDIGLQMDF